MVIDRVRHLENCLNQEKPFSLSHRLKKLMTLQQVIKKRESEIHQALKKDLGKSSFESYATEVGFILSEINHTLKHLKKWATPQKVQTPLTLFPGKSHIQPEPYGLVFIITPWNYPFQQCLSPFIGAIAAGNRVVLKPSEFAEYTSLEVKTIIEEVFSGDEAIVIEGGVKETQELLKQRWDYIFFTGSQRVGKIIMKSAAENLTPLTLELGGKSPCLIHESARLDVAAKRCVWGKFLNAGQTCVAPDFVLIPRNLQDSFISKVRHWLVEFYGEVSSSHDYSRIVNQNHFNRLKKLINPSKVAVGGDLSEKDCYISPTVLKDVAWDDEVMEDEIFGPILPIIPYDDLAEALRGLKKLPKPLAFYHFCEDAGIKKKVLSQVSFGGGCINDTVVHLANPNLPFGGVGRSGFGSYHGKKSFDTFTHYKSIFEQSTLVDIPLRYPPYEGKINWLKMFLK